MDLGLLIGLLVGLISIAIAIFFGLRGFRTGVTDKLSSIEKNTELIGDIKDSAGRIEREVVVIHGTVDKSWDLLRDMRFGESQTVERNLENLGKVKITAEPGEEQTSYLIEIEKPILKEGYIAKISKETELSKQEKELFGQETGVRILSSNRLRLYLPSTEPAICTEYVTYLLKWLNSTYFESLSKIKDFEEPILL